MFLMPRVEEVDFATLRALMRNQLDFPPTYDQCMSSGRGASSRKRRRAADAPSSR